MIDPRRLAVLQAVATHGSALPPLGGRHIAAWHQAGPAQPPPATATVLDALAQTSQASQHTPDQATAPLERKPDRDSRLGHQ